MNKRQKTRLECKDRAFLRLATARECGASPHCWMHRRLCQTPCHMEHLQVLANQHCAAHGTLSKTPRLRLCANCYLLAPLAATMPWIPPREYDTELDTSVQKPDSPDVLEGKMPTKFVDPCKDAALQSMRCLERHGHDKLKCHNEFFLYRQCKKEFIRRRREFRNEQNKR